MRLKAIREMMYATRRLQAGDEFDAPDRDARILIAIRKAAKIRTPAPVPPPPPAVAEKIAAAVAPTEAKLAATGAISTVHMGSAPPPPKPAPPTRPLPATAPVPPPKPPGPKAG